MQCNSSRGTRIISSDIEWRHWKKRGSASNVSFTVSAGCYIEVEVRHRLIKCGEADGRLGSDSSTEPKFTMLVEIAAP